MKISVEEKMKEAEQMSLHHPDIFYMVMDKTGKRAIVTGDFCVYRERISDGYFTVATFKGDVLDIDYEDVKDKLPDNEADKVQQVQDDLDSIIPDDEGGGIGEQGTEGSTTDTA